MGVRGERPGGDEGGRGQGVARPQEGPSSRRARKELGEEGGADGEGGEVVEVDEEMARAIREQAKARELPATSSKRLPTRIDHVNEEWVGKVVPFALGGPGRQAKKAAMQLLNGDRSVANVQFSRISGIQEWRDAVALFVNVGTSEEGETYHNTFLEGGRQLTWFAQASQTPASAVIVRLTHRDASDPTRVVIFCRRPEEEYVALGEVELADFNPRVHPMKFVWTLRFFDRLMSSPAFARLMDLSLP